MATKHWFKSHVAMMFHWNHVFKCCTVVQGKVELRMTEMNAMEEVPLVVDTCYTDHGSLEFVVFSVIRLHWGGARLPDQPKSLMLVHTLLFSPTVKPWRFDPPASNGKTTYWEQGEDGLTYRVMKNGKIVNKVSVACLSKMIYNVPKPMAQIAIDQFFGSWK